MAEDEEVQASPVVDEAAPVNCTGDLALIPDGAPGQNYDLYRCQVCSQVVLVGHEDLAEVGLPPEHARAGA